MKTHLPSIALFVTGLIGPLGRAQQYIISTYAGGGLLPAIAGPTTLSIDWNSKGLTADAGGNTAAS